MSEQQSAQQSEEQSNEEHQRQPGQKSPEDGGQGEQQGGTSEQMFPESYVKQLRAEAKGYRTKLQEIEDSKKSEQQKLQERAEAAEKELARYKQAEEQAKWATDLSEEHGVPAGLLRGTSKKEMEDHAKQLKETLNPPEERRQVFPSLDKKPGKQPSDKKTFVGDLFARNE